MAIAETLAVYHDKSVLLVDADAQMNLSLMVMPPEKLEACRAGGVSIAAWLASHVLTYTRKDWEDCTAGDISDVDDATRLLIMPGDMDLTLVDRKISAIGAFDAARQACRRFLDEAAQWVDFILVDCAPGISVVTECWLRECDWHLIPVKPDILAVSGIDYLKRFKAHNPELGFAEHLGVLVNMLDTRSPVDRMTHDFLAKETDLRCFEAAIPLVHHIQKAALFLKEKRSYQNKYPAEAGQALRNAAAELLSRAAKVRKQAA
jgi:chromosome partitioning protein